MNIVAMKNINILFFSSFLLLNLREVVSQLPSWITSSPGFKSPTTVNSVAEGKGSIRMEEKQDAGWVIRLSEKLGYGAEVNLHDLRLNPSDRSYVAILGWPVTEKTFKEVKVFSGNLKESKKIRVADTKSILVVYSCSQDSKSPQMAFTYRRYGASYEKSPPTTESPVKKETQYEIQLKGKAPDQYLDETFVANLKTALVRMAQSFCLRENIPFNKTAQPADMVFISRISFCPFEWPDRELCASIQHSIFVSGTRSPNGIIIDYEMTADHLRDMWLTIPPHDIYKLGLTIFKLPETSDTVLWWCLIAGFVMAMSLIGILLFLGAERISFNQRFRGNSTTSETAARKKKTKPNVAQHQKIPSFMLRDDTLDAENFEYSASATPDNSATAPTSSSKLPIKSYFGGFLYNKAFEDEEESAVQCRKK